MLFRSASPLYFSLVRMETTTALPHTFLPPGVGMPCSVSNLYVHRKHKVVGNICQTSGQITVFVEAAYQITCELFCLFVCRCLIYLPEEILRKRLFGREYGRLHRIALPVEVVFYRIGSVIVVIKERFCCGSLQSYLFYVMCLSPQLIQP